MLRGRSLDAVASKVRSAFSADVAAASIDGTCPVPLFALMKAVAINIKCDTQDRDVQGPTVVYRTGVWDHRPNPTSFV